MAVMRLAFCVKDWNTAKGCSVNHTDCYDEVIGKKHTVLLQHTAVRWLS